MIDCGKDKTCTKNQPKVCSVCPESPIARIIYDWGYRGEMMVTDFRQTKKGGWVFQVNGLRSKKGEGEPLRNLLNNYFGHNK